MSSHTSTSHPPSPPSTVDGLLPLFIGITGHRDLRDEDMKPLREVVRREFKILRERYPHTPLMALSPLGEGADRVVACVAMEEGLSLIVPLPMPRERYEQSFSGDESRAEFASLLNRASHVFTLPWLVHGHEERIEAPPTGEPTAAQIEGQYAAMGAYLARYSHVLLALWDGDNLPEHERIGGTAHIVRFRLHGAPPPYGPPLSLLERGGYGAVHHILTPRKSRPLPANSKEPFTVQVVLSSEAEDDVHHTKVFEEDFHRIDIFNADILKTQASLGAQVQKNARSLVASAPEDAASKIPPSLDFPLSIYSWSDTLSTIFSRHTARTTRRIFLLVFFAALSFNLFHSLPHGSHGESGDHGPAAGHAAAGHASAEHEVVGGYATLFSSPASAAEDHGSSKGHASPPSSSSHGTSSATTHGTQAHGSEGTTHGPANTGSGSTAHGTDAHGSGTHGTEAGGSSHTTLASAQTEAVKASLWSLLPWFLWLYLILVVINIIVHDRAEKAEFQNKYQDYRALAEGLRVQIFWRLAGLHEDVTDHYLGKQRGELNWIRHAIKSCNVMADASQKGDKAPASSEFPLVLQRWAKEQRDYYIGKTHREHHALEKQEKIIGAFVIGSVLMALVLGLILSLPSLFPVPFLEPLKHRIEEPFTHAIVMIAIVMSAVTAGLLHAYNAQLARAEHTKRYGRMGILFASACKEIEAQMAKGNTHKTTAILHELGREALAENGDWVLLHRERPLEVPHAG